jgi:hypothetical protein
MLFLPSAYHSALIQNWLRSLLTTSCMRIMLRRCYTCNAVMKPCLMNYFSMPAPSSSPHPHPTMASPSSTLTRYGVTANYVPTHSSFIHHCDFCTIFCYKGENLHLSIFVSPCCVMNPGNVIFLFSFFLCCYSDTLEYGHHLEAVQDAYRLQLKLFLSEVANGSFFLAFEAS